METQTAYQHLVQRSDKQGQELFLRGSGVRASTIWHDRYVSCLSPKRIAQGRDLPMEAVLEALAYCQDHWDVICADKAAERTWLAEQGFFGGGGEDASATS